MTSKGVPLMLLAIISAIVLECGSIPAWVNHMKIMPNPIHASCDADWYIGVNCSVVSSKIKAQIDLWKGDDCGTSEKCKYTFVSEENNVLKAKHTTPVHNYVDDLTFTFKDAGASACSVNGKSSSETWYAVLDYSTNYCNLHNLIAGSGLNKTAGYKETTNDFKCTQYSSANCEKY